MATLDATAGGPTSNSYCDVTYATDYLTTSRLNFSAWTGATLVTQSAALMWATRMLDEIMTWKGIRYKLSFDSVGNPVQALRWPRSAVQDADGYWYPFNTIPDVVKQAAAGLAIALIEKNRILEPALLGQGFVDASGAGFAVKVDRSQILSLIPMHVLAKLQFVGSAQGLGVGGIVQATLIRS